MLFVLVILFAVLPAHADFFPPSTEKIVFGMWLTLTKSEHQASHRVWPTELRGGKFIPSKWEEPTLVTRD